MKVTIINQSEGLKSSIQKNWTENAVVASGLYYHLSESSYENKHQSLCHELASLVPKLNFWLVVNLDWLMLSVSVNHK